MSNDQPGFNPYHKWLGIPKDIAEPNHYQLLSLAVFETDPEVISSAADAQRGFLRTFQNGPHAELAKRVLDEVAEARKCLLQKDAKAEYDAQLREQLRANAEAAKAAIIPEVAPTMALPTGIAAADLSEEEREAAEIETGESEEETAPEEEIPTAVAAVVDDTEEEEGEFNFVTAPVHAVTSDEGAEGAEEEEEAPRLPKAKKKIKRSKKTAAPKKLRANVQYTPKRALGEDSGVVVNERPVKIFKQIVLPILLVLLFIASMFWLSYSSRHKEAKKLYEKSVEYVERGDLDKAKKRIDKAVRLNTRRADNEIYVAHQQMVDAKIKERDEMLWNKKWADGHFQTAMSLMETQKWVEADKEIDKALRKFPYEQQYIERKLQIAKKRGYTWEPKKRPEGEPTPEAASGTAMAGGEAAEGAKAPAKDDLFADAPKAEKKAEEESKENESEEFSFSAPTLKSGAKKNKKEEKQEEAKAETEEKAETDAKPADSEPAPAATADGKPKASKTYDKKTTSGTRLVKVVDGVEFPFRFCKYGTFKLGAEDSETDDAYKRRDGQVDEAWYMVSLSDSYWMLETEVTRKMWRAIMGGADGDDALPMTNISWDEANTFCQKLSEKIGMDVRLPTEAQWEYACRAGVKFMYSGSRSSDLYAIGWYADGKSGSNVHPVAQKDANHWGMFDMHGNAAEWCSDWCADYPKVRNTSVDDPTGPKSGTRRACRGGSIRSSDSECRSASRNAFPPDYKAPDVGFRIMAY